MAVTVVECLLGGEAFRGIIGLSSLFCRKNQDVESVPVISPRSSKFEFEFMKFPKADLIPVLI